MTKEDGQVESVISSLLGMLQAVVPTDEVDDTWKQAVEQVQRRPDLVSEDLQDLVSKRAKETQEFISFLDSIHECPLEGVDLFDGFVPESDVPSVEPGDIFD